MASFIQKLLDALGSKEPPAKRRRTRPRTATGTERCEQCGGPVSLRATRCPACGKRTTAPIHAASPPSASTPRRGARFDLSRLESDILIAAARADSQVHAFRSGAGDSEIKAGETRVAGEQGVAAVRNLLEAGLIEPIDESSFALTDEGRRVADTVQSR